MNLKRFKKITSREIKVIVTATREEKFFSTLQNAEEWMKKVVQTFQEPMEFFISEITEKSKNVKVTENGEIHSF